MQAKLIDLLTKARAAFQSQNYSEAEALANKALKLDGASPDAHMTMGILKASTGQLEEAIQHFKAVLKVQPQLAQVRANLATALYEHQDYEEAIIEFEKALRADPNLIKARLTYASTLRKASHYDKAIDEYQKILSRYPQSHEALNGAGLTYMNQDKEDESLHAFHNATQLAPMASEYRLNFAIALDGFNYPAFARVQYEEALKIKPDWLEAKKYLIDNLLKARDLHQAEMQINSVLRIHPRDADLIPKKGRLLIEKQDYDAAMGYFKEALSIDPDNIEAKMGIASAFSQQGNFVDAISIYEELITKEPKISLSYGPYARIKKFDKDDPFVNRIETNLLHAEHLLKSDAVNFALGKIYDDCKDWKTAFGYYQRGNELVNRFAHYNKEEEQKFFDEIIACFSIDHVKKLNVLGVGKDLPILIIGMPRSGTTLTEDIVARHSKVSAAGEVGYWSTKC